MNGSTRPKYHKLVYSKWDDLLGIQEAIAQNNYLKYYYLDETTVGRVDQYFEWHGLFMVSYRQAPPPPYDDALARHFLEHPTALCEFQTSPVATLEGLRLVRTYRYKPPKTLDQMHEVYLDVHDRVLKRIEIGSNGQRIREEHRVYNEKGELIGTKYYDEAGRLVNDHDFLRDDS
jgi:hypothetical protein